MKKDKHTIAEALDRVVFGSSDTAIIEKKLDTMEEFLELESSSLGHSLAGIRHRQNLSYAKAAEKAGISVETWRSWESDLKTPNPTELAEVLKKLHWSWELPRFLALREQASRVKLSRLLNLSPKLQAAKGSAGVSSSYEWSSLDESLKVLLKSWAQARELEMPKDLVKVLSQLVSREEQEAWIQEVLNFEASL